MHRSIPIAPSLIIACAAILAFTAVAAAQTVTGVGAGGGNGFNVSWAALDPGNDWAAQMIQSVFPVNGAGPVPTGSAANVIGQIIGQLTGFVAAITMAYVSYTTIHHIHRVAESSQILTNNMTSLFLVRLGFAAIMMFPLQSGFSTGQAAVVQTSMWGIGMARVVYTNAVQAIGPDAMTIASPPVPGTAQTVIGLIQNELCMALINAAAGHVIIPQPIATSVSSSSARAFTWSYGLSAGSETGAPICGTITIGVPDVTTSTNFANVSTEMGPQQRAILETVLANDIRPGVQFAAQQFWQTKQASALNYLLGTYQGATADYTSQLESAASNVMSQLRGGIQPSDARAGNLGEIPNETQISSLGWTSAAAYYLDFARLNATTLSIIATKPIINTPSYDGLSQALKSDIAPLASSATQFLTRMNAYVQTSDPTESPNANAGLFSGVTPPLGGDGIIESIFRKLDFTQPILQTLVNTMSPTGTEWADPFGGLMAMGQNLITVAVTALGLQAAMASDAGTATTTIGAVLSGNWGLAGPILFGSTVAKAALAALSVPIFMFIMSMMLPGLLIAFVLPMIPWLMWMAGVAGYLILVCEAVVAVPLWMLAHMTFEGEGLHGRAIAGYELLFNILFRPVLMLIGLFLGYFVFSSMSWLIRMNFGIAAGFVLQNGGVVANYVGFLVLLYIFVFAHIGMAFISFNLISLIPHHIPKLIGFSSANRVDMNQFAQEAAMVGLAGQTLSGYSAQISTAPVAAGQEIAGGIGTAFQRYQAKRLTPPKTNESGDAAAGNMDSTLRATTDTNYTPPKD